VFVLIIVYSSLVRLSELSKSVGFMSRGC
jgi:hypothetical protein